MPDLFYTLGYNLGRALSPRLRQANWLLRSLTGTEAEAIRAEFAVGRDLARSFSRQFEVCADPAVHDLVTELGTRLADRVTVPDWRFTFAVVTPPEVNAFALPGGFVFLTRSLVEFCERDRDELAFIVGHEMGHIVRRHAMDRLMANTVLRAAVTGLATARGVAGQSLAGLATTVFQKSYAQDQEFEADRFGAQLAQRAGFDPAAASRALKRLGAQAREGGPLSAYFSSHPPLKLRVQHLE
jgi:beta-barrel assembly-enhancing protease